MPTYWDSFCSKYGERVQGYPLAVILKAFYWAANGTGTWDENDKKAEQVLAEYEEHKEAAK